jgi:hypothetical protein
VQNKEYRRVKMMMLPITLIIFILFLCFIFMYIRSIYVHIRNGEKIRGIVKALIFLLAAGTFYFMAIYPLSSRMPIVFKGNTKQYVMDINQVKEDGKGTKVKVKKALLDLSNISFTMGVKGKEKLVAVEIKKNPEDKDALGSISGLWLGNRFAYHYNGYGAGYSSNEFIEPLYLVCYLSNGEEVIFKIEDKNHAKDQTKFFEINKEIEFEGKKIRIKNLKRALNYTSIEMDSNDGQVHPEVSIIQEGKESEKASGRWGGGGSKYDYNFYFDPIEDKDIKLKIKSTGSDKEYLLDIY